MAIWDMFRRKKELSFEKELGIPGLAEAALPKKEFGFEEETGLPKAPSFEPEPSMAPTAFKEQAAFQAAPTSKDLELISAKLDAIKAMLENISSRLAALEREHVKEEQQKRIGWYA